MLGFLGQPPSLIPVLRTPRPQCDHIRRVPGRVEGVCGAAIEAFVEVPVDVENGLDAGVSKSRRDDGWVGAFSDEERDVAVAEIVVMPTSAGRDSGVRVIAVFGSA